VFDDTAKFDNCIFNIIITIQNEPKSIRYKTTINKTKTTQTTTY